MHFEPLYGAGLLFNPGKTQMLPQGWQQVADNLISRAQLNGAMKMVESCEEGTAANQRSG